MTLSFGQYSSIGCRKSMEDFMIVYPSIKINSNLYSLFGVFDGHGGSKVSEYCKSNFLPVWKDLMEKNEKNEDKGEVLQKVFEKLDQKILENKKWDFCGSTATVLLIDLKRHLFWSCHVGDSYLVYDFKVLTNSHHPSTAQEKERLTKIKKIHLVLNDRLNGSLAVSRSLGDSAFRKFGLVSTPDVYYSSIVTHQKEKEKEKEDEHEPALKKQKLEKYKIFMLFTDGLINIYPKSDDIKDFIINEVEKKGVCHLPKIAEQIVRQEFRSKDEKKLMRDNTSLILVAVLMY